MAEIEVDIGGDIRPDITAPEARWSLNKALARVRSLPQNFNDDYYSHPIFENIRKQEMGKLFLGAVVPVFGGIAYLLFNLSNPNETLFEFILLVLLAGAVALFIGLLFSDTYRRLARLLELLGIVFVCLSITGLFASLLSGPALIIPASCATILVLLPFIIPFLPRENDSNRTN